MQLNSRSAEELPVQRLGAFENTAEDWEMPELKLTGRGSNFALFV